MLKVNRNQYIDFQIHEAIQEATKTSRALILREASCQK